MTEKKLGIIGVGNMGGAIARGILKNGLFGTDEVVFCDAIPEKADALAQELHLEALATASQVADAASTVLLAVKPQTMEQCLEQTKEAAERPELVISIAAGITTRFIEGHLGEGTRVVRVMPNTPALVGAGASAICAGRHAREGDLDETEMIFAALGKVYRLDESMIDAVTAVSGSGPAYLFLFAECLERAAAEAGLPGDIVPELVAQTLFGAAKLLIESPETAATLRERVTSPGGTTEAALAALGERDFEQIIVDAIKAALDRAGELGGVKKS